MTHPTDEDVAQTQRDLLDDLDRVVDALIDQR